MLGASLRHPKPDLSLLRVNKAIAVEAAYEFYATNTFHFRSSYVHWPGPDNFYVSRIRSTVLTWSVPVSSGRLITQATLTSSPGSSPSDPTLA